MKLRLLTVNLNVEPKEKILLEIEQKLSEKHKIFIVTPNPEFFYATFRDYEFEKVLNSADFALPDGIGLLWAAHYLEIPLRSKGYYSKIFEAFWQLFYTYLEIIFAPKKIHSVIRQRITGSDFFWDLLQLAARENKSVYLLGGRDRIAERAALEIKKVYPQIKIAGASSKNPYDPSIAAEINNSKADFLFVAYGQVKQEKWISHNLPELEIQLAIGVGGTLDYVAKSLPQAPRAMRNAGLEWLFRLMVQPRRFDRILRAVFGFSRGVMRHKVFVSMPYRENVVGVIINSENKIFLGLRVNDHAEEHWQFPQGGVDSGEDYEKAILREIFEETSLQDLIIMGRAKASYQYDWSHGRRELFGNKLKFRGQKQTVYFLKFNGSDTEIDLSAHDREFSKFKWVAPHDLEDRAHPFRVPLIKLIKEDLEKIIERNSDARK